MMLLPTISVTSYVKWQINKLLFIFRELKCLLPEVQMKPTPLTIHLKISKHYTTFHASPVSIQEGKFRNLLCLAFALHPSPVQNQTGVLIVTCSLLSTVDSVNISQTNEAALLICLPPLLTWASCTQFSCSHRSSLHQLPQVGQSNPSGPRSSWEQHASPTSPDGP